MFTDFVNESRALKATLSIASMDMSTIREAPVLEEVPERIAVVA